MTVGARGREFIARLLISTRFDLPLECCTALAAVTAPRHADSKARLPCESPRPLASRGAPCLVALPAHCRFRTRLAAETDPQPRAAPDATLAPVQRAVPSEGAVHFLDRVAASRAWPCLGVEPSQSSPRSMTSVGALWTERCWLASVLRRCRPRRTTRRAAPRPRPRAAVVARPRRRSVLTLQPRTQLPWHSMGVSITGGEEGGGSSQTRAATKVGC